MAFSILASGSGGTDANSATTGAIDTTGADLIVVVVATYDGASENVTDSEGNSWTAGTQYGGDTGYNIHYAYCVNPTTSASHTFTYSESASYPSIHVVAVSGVDTGDAFEAENGDIQFSPGSITPAVDGSLLVSGTASENTDGSAIDVDSSYTIQSYQSAAGGVTVGGAIATLIQGTAGAVNPTWSNTSGIARTNHICFNPGSASGPTITDVDGDESWQDGATGLVITGTGFVG